MSSNRTRDETFTPFTRLPPIGSKNNTFKNYRTDSMALELGMRNPSFPMRKRKLSKSVESPKLIRRKTYIVLEPLVCKSKQSK